RRLDHLALARREDIIHEPTPGVVIPCRRDLFQHNIVACRFYSAKHRPPVIVACRFYSAKHRPPVIVACRFYSAKHRPPVKVSSWVTVIAFEGICCARRPVASRWYATKASSTPGKFRPVKTILCLDSASQDPHN